MGLVYYQHCKGCSYEYSYNFLVVCLPAINADALDKKDWKVAYTICEVGECMGVTAESRSRKSRWLISHG